MSSAHAKYLPPRVADHIRGLAISSRLPMQGGIQGLHRSPDFGASVEFAEYRDYIEGDAPNLIDWQVFAKTDRYMIRRFQDETSLRATVLVDASASLNFRQTGPVTKFEYACSLAAGFDVPPRLPGRFRRALLFHRWYHAKDSRRSPAPKRSVPFSSRWKASRPKAWAISRSRSMRRRKC